MILKKPLKIVKREPILEPMPFTKSTTTCNGPKPAPRPRPLKPRNPSRPGFLGIKRRRNR